MGNFRVMSLAYALCGSHACQHNLQIFVSQKFLVSFKTSGKHSDNHSCSTSKSLTALSTPKSFSVPTAKVQRTKVRTADPSGRRGSAAARLLGLLVRIPLGALVSVVCCQVEVSATGWSLVQRSPTDCVVSNVCDREGTKNEAAQAPKGLSNHWKKKKSGHPAKRADWFSTPNPQATVSLFHVLSDSAEKMCGGPSCTNRMC
jgi:hypothetical protein